MKTIISISKCEKDNVRDAVFDAIGKTDFKQKKIQSVIIKPNLCYYWDSSIGETTDKRVVAAIIDYIREFCNPNADIRKAEADATAMKTRHVFKMLGYDQLAIEKKVELFNLCDDEFEEIEIKIKNGSLRIPIPISMLNSDLIINEPKLKVPRRIQLTCAMKNLFGRIQIQIKAKYHPYLHEVIAGVNSAIKPDLIVVDAIIALGRYPIKLGVIMAGTDSLVVDITAAKIVGYNNPNRNKEVNILNVEIVGDYINELKKHFKKVNNILFTLLWDLQLKGVKICTKVTGDVLPPILGDL